MGNCLFICVMKWYFICFKCFLGKIVKSMPMKLVKEVCGLF